MKRTSALSISATRRLVMRFDGERPKVTIKEVDASLRPRVLDAQHTPYPLPRYDEAFGFGPTRVANVPDVARAKEALKAHLRVAETTFAEMDPSYDTVSDALQASSTASTAATSATPDTPAYVQEAGYPLLDRLVSTRSVDDLLNQFLEHPTQEGKSAALSDLASTLLSRTPEELSKMFSTLGGTIEPDGKGFHFFGQRVNGYMTQFFTPGALLGGFTNFVTAVEEMMLAEDGEGTILSRCPPRMIVELLHFLARAKILEPDLWFTAHDTFRSATASSLGSKGHNKHHYLKGHGVALLDGIKDLLDQSRAGHETPYLAQCSGEELVELLTGLSAVDPSGFVDSTVANTILDFAIHKIPEDLAVIGEAKTAEVAGRLALAAKMSHIYCREVDDLVDRYSVNGPQMMALARRKPANEDLFEKRVREFHASATATTNSITDSTNVHEAWQGVCELLQSFPCKERASRLALELGLDGKILESIPHFKIVGEMLSASQGKLGAQAALTTKTRSLFTYCAGLQRIRGLVSTSVFHSSTVVNDLAPLVQACLRLRTGRVGLVVTTQTLLTLSRMAATSVRPSVRQRSLRSLQLLAYEVRRGRACLVPLTDELSHIRDAGSYADEDLMAWMVVASLVRDAPLTKPQVIMKSGHIATRPHQFLKTAGLLEKHGGASSALLTYSSGLIGQQKELARRSNLLATRDLHAGRFDHTLTRIRDQKSKVHSYDTRRSRFAYRRDRALFDKFRPRGRHIAAGFAAGGALNDDLRGLGIHTPDHPQPAGGLRCVAKPHSSKRTAFPQ